MIVGIGLSGRLVATGLGIMVEQPDPGGILGPFVAIFSLATQFEMCPFGWYNRRMELSGGTTGIFSLGFLSQPT